MSGTDTQPSLLLPHRDTPGEAVRRIAARAELGRDGSLRLRYVLEGDPRRLRIPPPAADAGRADRLWTHTCFEAFVRAADSPDYLELNFSPSGHWAAYRFQSYREGMAPAALREPPRLAMRREDGRLELETEVRWGLPPGSPAGLPPAAASGGVRIGLSAVVEDREGRLSYWALRHPAGRPDFHHPESFALTLQSPATPPNP